MKKNVTQGNEFATTAKAPLAHQAIRSLSAEEIQTVIGGCGGGGRNGTGGGNQDGSGPGNGDGMGPQ